LSIFNFKQIFQEDVEEYHVREVLFSSGHDFITNLKKNSGYEAKSPSMFLLRISLKYSQNTKTQKRN